VPFHAYCADDIFSPYVQLLAPKHGGHVAFIQKVAERERNLDRFWAENRVIEFCTELLKNHPNTLQQH
jgi:predicted alpha/beta-fold hydrolase